MFRLKKYLIAMITLSVIGCASSPSREGVAVHTPTARTFENLPKSQHRPKLVLVLSGGGLRGFAHVGVLNVLSEQGIVPDVIVGSSAGALVGVLYARHRDMPLLRNDIFSISPDHFAKLALPRLPLLSWLPGSLGVLHFDGFEAFLAKKLGNCRLERLIPRTYVVATELQTGTAVAFDSGDCARAIHASSAIPGLAVPVTMGSRMYVDGQISSPLPVEAARALGGRIILAVNVVYAPTDSAIESYPSVFMQGWNSTIYALSKLQEQQADILITPQFRSTSQFTLIDREEIVAAGETAMRNSMPTLKTLLDKMHVVEQSEGN